MIIIIIIIFTFIFPICTSVPSSAGAWSIEVYGFRREGEYVCTKYVSLCISMKIEQAVSFPTDGW